MDKKFKQILIRTVSMLINIHYAILPVNLMPTMIYGNQLRSNITVCNVNFDKLYIYIILPLD